MYEVNCTIEGLVPLMNDRFNPLLTEMPRPKKGKDDWKKQLPLKMWKDKAGVYMPADNIRMMLIGNKHRVGAAKILGSYIESKKATEYLNFCKSCVWVLGQKDPLKVHISKKRTTYDDYDERSFINASGSRSITRRPIFKTPWSFEFTVQVTDEQFGEQKIKEFFDVAGLRCGLGAYGPTFGRFIIKKWELKKQAV